ncbi:MAG TPA: lysophospholipid transporter LplT [Methylotenera sp.]|jgi:MFS family permease|nr:lysophospholipid transporter LplT [Methylotenera sp.]HPV32122.1 lysophospholipid transporter LplT [Methylotenera sp.]
MAKGFYTFLIAQFLSAIADNALLFACIALLSTLNAPEWHVPFLKETFVVSYIILAPFVGSFADALPKGRVMFISNGIKFFGCVLALLGVPPLFAYAIVGIGAAAYSPAKYGILTEMLPSNQLIKANAWVEGTTVSAIILGPVLGSTIAADNPYFGIAIIAVVYLLAAFFNHFIPKVPIDHKVAQRSLTFLIRDFWHAFTTLWKDTQGQVALAVTTLFWGAGATLQFVILQWAKEVLGMDQQAATVLIAILAIGIAVGSVGASMFVKLEEAVKVLPSGILMGFLVVSMIFVETREVAAVVLFCIGVLAGYFLVPLNSLLQHRGHILLGAGHSIAVQNFNENIGILLLLGIYTFMVHQNLPINFIIIIFGIFVSVSMAVIYQLYLKHTRANAA